MISFDEAVAGTDSIFAGLYGSEHSVHIVASQQICLKLRCPFLVILRLPVMVLLNFQSISLQQALSGKTTR